MLLNHPKLFNCDACTRKHCDESGEIEGSRGIGPPGLHEIPGVVNSRVCLKPLINRWSSSIVGLYGHYSAGHLAVDGGVIDQPFVYLRAMEIISACHQKG